MSEQYIGEMIGLYRSKSRFRKDPETYNFWTFERFPVAIRRMTADDAPLAFRMQVRTRRGPRWVEWRIVDGVLMREALDQALSSISADKLSDPKGHDYSRSGLPWDHPEHFWEDNLDPRDYPYETHCSREHILEGKAAVGNPPFWKWALDERDSAAERVQRVAAEDLAIIDGTVFKRAAEPSIRVSWKSSYSPHGVALAIDGCIAEQRSDDFEGAAWFRADERETANTLVDLIVDGGRDDAGIYSEADFIRIMPNFEIEITGAWQPRFEAHEAAVGATSKLFGMHINSRSSSLATSMAVNALHLAARAPILGDNPISTEEAWSIFCRSAYDPSADLSHAALSRMDAMAQKARDLRMAADEPGLSHFSV